MMIFLTYLFSFIIFKIVSVLDRKYDLFPDGDDAWIENNIGRQKIYLIFFLIPWLNIIIALLVLIALGFAYISEKDINLF